MINLLSFRSLSFLDFLVGPMLLILSTLFNPLSEHFNFLRIQDLVRLRRRHNFFFLFASDS